MINKFIASLRVSVLQISLAALLVSAGILLDAYVRVGHLTFFSVAIFITLGLFFPLWLGIASAILIDTFALMLRGVIGFWFWSLQIEPIIIVLLTFSIRFIYFNIKQIKWIIVINIFLLIAFTTAFIYAMVTNWNHLKIESNMSTRQISSAIKSYFALAGFVMMIIFLIFQILQIKNQKGNLDKYKFFIIILISSILMDWIYHPWAVWEWQHKVLGLEKNSALFTANFVSGIWNSAFHVVFGAPLAYSISLVFSKTTSIHKNKY